MGKDLKEVRSLLHGYMGCGVSTKGQWCPATAVSLVCFRNHQDAGAAVTEKSGGEQEELGHLQSEKLGTEIGISVQFVI